MTMFYTDLDLDVPKGSIVLLSGSTLSGISTITKYLCLDALERDEAIIYISTKDSGEKIQQWFSERIETKGLGVVDCISKSLRMETDIKDSEWIKYVSSSVDLTGISVKYSNLLEKLWNVKNYEDIRIVIDSLSTILMYSNAQTVFRFLHILTGRIKKLDGYGIFTLEETPEDVETKSINQLMDVITEIKENKMLFRGFGINKEVTFKIENGELRVGET